MVNFYKQHRRSGFDRRTGEERRRVLSLDYFVNGKERRIGAERRRRGEMRKGWFRVNKWSSVLVGSKARKG